MNFQCHTTWLQQTYRIYKDLAIIVRNNVIYGMGRIGDNGVVITNDSAINFDPEHSLDLGTYFLKNKEQIEEKYSAKFLKGAEVSGIANFVKNLNTYFKE